MGVRNRRQTIVNAQAFESLFPRQGRCLKGYPRVEDVVPCRPPGEVERIVGGLPIRGGGKKVNLYQALDITPRGNELIAFVGAGGKTTALFTLAGELRKCDKSVLVTTTTAIYSPGEGVCDRVITGSETGSLLRRISGPAIVAMGREITPERKMLGIDGEVLTAFHRKKLFDCILVEADGSRRLPIKAPAAHEPVIPGGTTRTVGVIGLDALGRRINSSSVHRPERFCRITGRSMGERIDEQVIARLILAPEGLFKSVTGTSRRYILMNKVNSSERQAAASCIVEAVQKTSFPVAGFIFADMLTGRISRVA